MKKNTGENNMSKGYSDSNMKPDKTCHYKKEDMGTMAKDAKLPGQMYVPKTTSNESQNFAGDKR
jgi:hypothetical protein